MSGPELSSEAVEPVHGRSPAVEVHDLTVAYHTQPVLWDVDLHLPEDHVHRPAEDMEHAFTDEAVESLAALLRYPTEDPHGQPIPPGRAA